MFSSIRICALGLCLGSLAILANCSEPTAEADPAAGRKPVVVSGVVEPPVTAAIPDPSPSGTPDVSGVASIEWAHVVTVDLGAALKGQVGSISIQAFRETIGTQVRVAARLSFSSSFYLNASGLKSLISVIDDLDAVRFNPRPKNITQRQTRVKWNNVVLQKNDDWLAIWHPGHHRGGDGFWVPFQAARFKGALRKAIEEIESLAKTPPSIEVGR